MEGLSLWFATDIVNNHMAGCLRFRDMLTPFSSASACSDPILLSCVVCVYKDSHHRRYDSLSRLDIIAPQEQAIKNKLGDNDFGCLGILTAYGINLVVESQI